MSDYVECPGCRKQLKRTLSKKYRKHKEYGKPYDCDYAGTVIPPEEPCQKESSSPVTSTSASSVTQPPDDAATDVEPVTSTPPSSSTPAPSDASTPATAEPALTGVEDYIEKLDDLAQTQLTAYKARVDEKLTPFSQPADHYEVEQPPLFSQPAGARSEEPAVEMGDLGKELTARLKEMFHAYDNRRSADNRSAQKTMGPSEMGTPCERRLALSLMRMPPVNPGGDGWAAFVGTCIHAGLEAMFVWADAGTGRFSVEQRLEFPSAIVPKGTADLIDRTLFMLDDHKCQGRWSRNKLKTTGPIRTYRVQAHVYAHGARLRGERIDHVAIISWPRDESTLDDLYVWTEPYRPDIVQEAFERIDRIAASVEENMGDLREGGALEPSLDEYNLKAKATVAAGFDVADDCRFCPFYLPNARDITKGCNGKR